MSPVDARIAAWDTAAGPFLLLAAGGGAGNAQLIRPEDVEGRFDGGDTAGVVTLSGRPVDLFNRAGLVGSAVVRPAPASTASECASFPLARIEHARRGWLVALAAGKAGAIALDSLDAMSPADSASFTKAVLDAIATVPAAQDTTFRGIPFVVAQGYRFTSGGVETLIASVHRGIPSEADPREEIVFVIAERSAGSATVPRVGLVRDATGVGDAVPVIDVLAAVRPVATGRPVLIVADEEESGRTVRFIQRIGAGRWRPGWTSAYVEC